MSPRNWLIALALLAGSPLLPVAGLLGAPLLLAGEPDKDKDKDKEDEPEKSVDADAVYYGNAKTWEKPAEVDIDAVYAEIDEYKQILEKGLEPGDAEYGILLLKCSRRFRKAVRAAAKAGGYDLVAGVGAVHGVETIDDITQDVIDDL